MRVKYTASTDFDALLNCCNKFMNLKVHYFSQTRQYIQHGIYINLNTQELKRSMPFPQYLVYVLIYYPKLE